MRILAILLLAASVSAPALAASDPAAGSDVPIQPILEQDTHLQERVRLHLKRRPLSAVVAEIGGKAGVTLTAASDVADEPATVYVTDQPAKDVMHHLAELFNFRWTRKGAPGAYSYEIYQDLKSKQEEEALRQADRLRAFQSLQAAVRERLELVQRPAEQLRREAQSLETAGIPTMQPQLRGPDGQLPPLFATDAYRALVHREAPVPRLREMADPLQRALLRVPAALRPQDWNALTGGDVLRFSTRAAPGASLLSPTLTAELRAADPSHEPPGMSPPALSASDAALVRESTGQFQRDWMHAEAFQISAWLEIKTRNFGPLDVIAPAGVRQATQATLYVVPTAVMPADFRGPSPAPFGLEISGEEVLPNEDGRPADAPLAANDPVLTMKRPFKIALRASDPMPFPTVPSLNELLPAIAETYHINLVADAYGQQRAALPPPPSSEERSLREVLDEYVLPQARWTRVGTFLHVRRHTWYRDRLGEIPVRVVTYWYGRLVKCHALSLDDAAALALSLRDEQLENFEAYLRDAGIRLVNSSFSRGQFNQEVIRNKDLLRSYGSLSPAQRQLLQAGSSVACTAISRGGRAWLNGALRQRQRLPADPHDRWGYALPTAATEETATALSLSRAIIAEQGTGRNRYERVEFHLTYGANQPGVSLSIALPSIEKKPQNEAPILGEHGKQRSPGTGQRSD
jgi:hypothetical protein